MDCIKTGALIRSLRRELGLTQLSLANKLNLSDKTVSKWERGCGCPDLSLLPELSNIFGVNIENLLNGNVGADAQVSGNMKKAKYYLCPECGNLLFSTGDAGIFCCGRKLLPLKAKKALDSEKLKVEKIEDEWFVTSDHPMTRDSFISFAVFVTDDGVKVIKLFPEWEMQIRLHALRHGTLYFYSTTDGFFYQYI